jgi:hypothetical protein
VSDDDKISATYTGLGIDWNQRGFSIDYPLQIQAKAEADYFMVKREKGRKKERERSDPLLGT